MGFSSGSVSFRRFAVIGQQPKTLGEDLVEKLEAHALKEGEFGVPEEVEYGWSGGRHVLDASFSFENNVYGDALVAAMRVDTNKVPGSLKKAYTLMEEEAVAKTNPSGFISKNQKREVKDVVRRKLDDDLRSGRFRRSKLIPILWDIPAGVLYSTASGTSLEKLMELFERTFELQLFPLSAGSIAMRLLEPRGKRRDYEDLRPTRFVPGPEGEGQYPEYAWVMKGPEPKDFLGNEFLVWLWHEAEHRDGEIKTESNGTVSLFIDRSLDLDCSYGQTGRDSLRGTGPSRMPEARDALRSGKVPRKTGLTLESAGHQFTLNFAAETFAVGSAKLPDVEDAENERAVFEERIVMMRDLAKAIDGLFDTFLKQRCSSDWEGHVSNIRKWMQNTKKPHATVFVETPV